MDPISTKYGFDRHNSLTVAHWLNTKVPIHPDVEKILKGLFDRAVDAEHLLSIVRRLPEQIIGRLPAQPDIDGNESVIKTCDDLRVSFAASLDKLLTIVPSDYKPALNADPQVKAILTECSEIQVQALTTLEVVQKTISQLQDVIHQAGTVLRQLESEDAEESMLTRARAILHPTARW